jgi:arginase family enzyme
MDIRDYFYPVDFSVYANINEKFFKYSLGASIVKTIENIDWTDLHELDIAIIGAPFVNGECQEGKKSVPDRIRGYLYKLACNDKQLKIIDFGNLKPASSKKGTYLALRDIIDYFNEKDIRTVVIGGSHDLTSGICEAYTKNRFFTLTLADGQFDVKRGTEQFSHTNFLSRIFRNRPDIFQFNLLGFQNHLVGEYLIRKTGISGEYLRLGRLRDDFLLAEPVLRDTDVFSIDMGVVSFGFAPATIQKNPNGLRGEEVCQLSRYAGLSNRLKVLGLFEIYPDEDNYDQTLKLASEIIWYFIDGHSYRSESGEMLEYKVEISGLEQPMVFLRETLTGRWWFEINSISGEKILIACSENDYRKASDNEIPGRWIKIMQKMDDLSK